MIGKFCKNDHALSPGKSFVIKMLTDDPFATADILIFYVFCQTGDVYVYHAWDVH